MTFLKSQHGEIDETEAKVVSGRHKRVDLAPTHLLFLLLSRK